MHPRRPAVDSTGDLRPRHANAAKERPERNVDALGEVCHHPFLIERNDPHLPVRKILRPDTTPRTERVVRVWNRQLDLLNSHFEDITGFRAFNEDWARQNMSTWTFVRDFLVDVSQRLLDIFRLHTSAFQACRTRSNQCLNLNS